MTSLQGNNKLHRGANAYRNFEAGLPRQATRHALGRSLISSRSMPLLARAVSTETEASTLTPRVPDVSSPSTADTSVQTSPAASSSKFTWTRNWWALLPVYMLDKERPTAHTILGQDLAVWYRKEDDSWHVFKDLCPHRMAALSEGRVQDGNLVCSYHGWAFGPSGACNNIPQIPAQDQSRVCSNKRTCVTSYPTTVENNMLYVWMDPSPEGVAESKNRGPPLNTGMGLDKWTSQEVMNDYQLWLEQAMDPSHANFLHAGGLFKPENAIVMETSAVPQVHPTQGFAYPHGGYDKKNADMKAVRVFIPPSTVVAVYKQSKATLLLHTTFTPVRPGVCRTNGLFKLLPKGSDPPIVSDALQHRQQQGQGAAPQQQDPPRPLTVSEKLVQGLMNFFVTVPHWMTIQWQLTDQDVVTLSQQGHKQRAEGLDHEHYFMPAVGADVGVAAVGRWMRMVGYPNSLFGAQPSATPPPSTEQLLDRYNRHMKYCVECQQGFAILTSICKGLTALVGACAVYAVASVAVAVVCQGGAAAAGWPAVAAAVAVAVLGPLTQGLWRTREYRFVNGAPQWFREGGVSLTPRKWA